MAKPKQKTRRAKLRARVGTTPADSVQASIRGDIKRLQRLAMSQSPMPLGAVPKAPQLDPKKYGATGADMQYGEVIRELRRNISRQDAQGDQNVRDLSKWFGEAKGSYETAAANNARSSEAAVAEQAAADAGIAASFGGGASEAAAALAQTAQGNQGYLRGMKQAGATADQSNIAAVAAEGAEAATQQRRIDEAREAELRMDLGDKQMLRGKAALAGEMEARDTNFQRAMSSFEANMNARNFNREGRSQRFQQLSSIPALKLSALMAGTQMTGAETDILNALDYPTGGSGSGSGTPRMPNGMTPNEYANQIYKRDKDAAARKERVGKDVRARRTKYFDDLTTALSGTTKDDEGNVTKNVRGAGNAMGKAVALAKARGLDLKKPAVQELILSGIETSVDNYDRKTYSKLLAQYVPAAGRRLPKPKPKTVAQKRASGR